MAFSQSIRKAQTPKVCDLCEKDTNINWKCIQCNTLMCNTCKKIHLKVQTSVQHEIVDVKSGGELGSGSVRTDNIPCEIHVKKLHCMFCRNCDTLVCPECISKSHRQHELESIDQVCPEMNERLGVSNYQIEKTLAFCEFQTEMIRSAEAKRNSLYSNALENIDRREKELKHEICKYASELRQRIEKEKEQTGVALSEKGKRIKTSESKLKDKQNQIQRAIESDQAGMIFSAASKFTEDVQNLSMQTLPKNILDFCSGEQSRQKVVNLFGLLKPTEIPDENCHFDLQTQKIYTTDLPIVERLLLQSNEKLWISSAEVLRQVEKDNKMKPVKEMSAKVVDITFTPRYGVLLTLADSSDVMQVTISGELKHFLSVSPLLGKGIHATNDGDIIVGVRETGDTYKVTKKSYRKIIIFGSDRQEKCSYEFDQNNQRLFTVPLRITTNVNKDIVVIDSTRKNIGRVVVLGKMGDFKWVYGGHPLINTGDCPFDPCDVVTSPVGHIIVADSENHALHVISGEGEVLMCKVINKQGIIFPESLDIDSRGQLWVGCNTYKGKIDAKIHVLKLY